MVDLDPKKSKPALIFEGLEEVARQLDAREQGLAGLEQELRDYSEVEGYLFVIGDQMKKVGVGGDQVDIAKGTVSGLAYVQMLRSWVKAVGRIVGRWKNGEFVDVLERELKAVEYVRMGKWFGARRCMEQLLGYIKNK